MSITIIGLTYTVINLKKQDTHQEETKEPSKKLTEEEVKNLFEQRYEKDLIDAQSLEIDEKRLEELAKDICNLNSTTYPITTCLTKEKIYQEFSNFTQQYLDSTSVLKNVELNSEKNMVIHGNGRVKALDYICTGKMKIDSVTENKIKYTVEHIYCAEMSQDCHKSGKDRTEEYTYVLEKIDDKWLVAEIGLPY